MTKFLRRRIKAIIDWMRWNIVYIGDWAQLHWFAVIIFMIVGMMNFLALVMLSWLYGFWSNGLYGTKFDLGSCWQGISVVITGFGGVAALAKTAISKYDTDSKLNSQEGKVPFQAIINNEYKAMEEEQEAAKKERHNYDELDPSEK